MKIKQISDCTEFVTRHRTDSVLDFGRRYFCLVVLLNSKAVISFKR